MEALTLSEEVAAESDVFGNGDVAATPRAGTHASVAAPVQPVLPAPKPHPPSPPTACVQRSALADLDEQLPALRARLLRYANLTLPDAGTAEDLVQDTLLVVSQQAHRWRRESSSVTWATSILKNKIADWYRSPNRRLSPLASAARASPLVGNLDDARSSDDGRCESQAAPATDQPEAHIERAQLMALLQRCIDCLPSKTAHVFVMREWFGYDTTEISQRLSVSAEHCRVLLFRAKTALRACMRRGTASSQ